MRSNTQRIYHPVSYIQFRASPSIREWVTNFPFSSANSTRYVPAPRPGPASKVGVVFQSQPNDTIIYTWNLISVEWEWELIFWINEKITISPTHQVPVSGNHVKLQTPQENWERRDGVLWNCRCQLNLGNSFVSIMRQNLCRGSQLA